ISTSVMRKSAEKLTPELDHFRRVTSPLSPCHLRGLKLDQVKRLKQLGQENGRLRRAVADLTLEKLVLKGAGHCPAPSGNW
ncbi:hypothetical protein, partial [Belnapia mucosa]|uniref:hypothetical protein n=1 Tax=Belnapia mucosa TaxID=2804532 RepID=UPI0038B27173